MMKARIEFGKDQIVIYERSSVEKFNYTEILSVKCDMPYLRLSTIIGREKLFFYNLKVLMSHLSDYFFQCNRSVIVNKHHVTRYYTKNKKTYITLINGESISVSRRNRGRLVKIIAIK